MQDKTPVKRISRACVRCRQRKSKCNLDTLGEPGVPPCQTCARAQVECVLATSKRGGRRIPKRAVIPPVNDSQQHGMPYSGPSRSHAVGLGRFQQPMAEQDSFQRKDPISPANIEETIAATDLHSTSEALNLLSHAAQLEAHGPSRHPYGTAASMSPLQTRPNGIGIVVDGSLQYPLVAQGLLTTAQVAQLVARFKQYYHPHLPIAPRRCFDPESLQYVASQEPHLLTAMITVASRDLPQGDNILQTCSSYMHQLVSELSAGKKCDVEAVEALLLLAEWEPQDPLSEAREVGCGEEDRAAWMHVGLALRIGYFLGLDRTALKHEDEDKAAHFNRRRVTWAACYISDRSLSARIGRAFWSRGPVALTAIRNGRRTFDEFPSLQPRSEEETDYASILQANLDLVQLFSNVHDVLYSGMGNSMRLMLAGNYVKYVDDFRSAIVGWKSNWLTLTCPPNIKAALQMSYEYLRLYTNAYAFQATVSRAVATRGLPGISKNEPPHSGVPSLPDARFIYESVDAAKSLISIINCYVDAENCLRFMPLRFSLYCVNSAVFLYKAWSFDVLSTQEKLGIRQMVRDLIRHLRKASVRPNDFTSRYSQLLERLWQRKDGGNGNGAGSTSVNSHPTTNVHGSSEPMPGPQPPAFYTTPDEFSWLDLQAVGELVSGQQEAGFGLEGNTHFMTMTGEWNDMGLMAGDDINRFF